MKRLFFSLMVFFLSTCTSENRLPGYVYYRLNTNPTTLDPALIVDVTGGSIAAKLFNGLVRLKEDLSVMPDIAERWSVSKDGMVYTFYLREDVRFSNGRPLTAHDFKYSFERALDPKTKSPNTWVFEKLSGAKEFMKGQSIGVGGIRVLDDYTLELNLERPFSSFLNLLTMTAAYVVPKEKVQELGPDFSGRPSGTGPFTLSEWLPNRHLILEARKDYFDGTAKVRGIFYRIIPEELTALAEFELGNLDVITVPASEYSRYRKSPEWSRLVSSMNGLNTYYLGLNCSRPPFDDPDLRRAINYAIDREKVLMTLYEGRGRLARGPVPDVMRKWPAPGAYPYDPGKAREIIKKAKPPAVNFYITAEQEVVDIAEVIQAYLREAGLDVRIRQLEWSAFKEAINKGETDMFWLSWWADYPDPENFLFPLFHSSNYGPSGNRVRYRNKEVDALIEKGQRAGSVKMRDMYYGKAEGIIVDDAPWVFFWHRTDYTVRQAWVKDYKIYPIYSMDRGLD
ncbi:MAG: ABC transporter substrate-binding protein [Thermodesulfovibrionales bacterium]|nr:ABC transporter substrate-binding protein [Thermodesulfovibrionales bacterium]